MEALNLQHITRETWRLWRAEPIVHGVVTLIVLGVGTLTLGIAVGPLLVGYIRLIVRQAAGESVRVSDLASARQDLLWSIVTWLVIVCSTALASLVVVLPGVVLGVLWSYALWFVAIEHAPPWHALVGSWRLTLAHVGPTLVVALTAVALNMVGVLLVVGVLISLPLAVIAMTLSFGAVAAAAPLKTSG